MHGLWRELLGSCNVSKICCLWHGAEPNMCLSLFCITIPYPWYFHTSPGKSSCQMPWPGQWGEVGRRLPRLCSPTQAKTQCPFPELESAFLLVQTFFILSCHLWLHYTFLFTFITFLSFSSKYFFFSVTEKRKRHLISLF